MVTIKMKTNTKMQYRQLSPFKETLDDSPPIKTKNINDIIDSSIVGINYEWLEHESIIKPYFDIDLFYVKEKDYVNHKKIDGFIKDQKDFEKKCKQILKSAITK